jgi:phage repressor protein C with HTH and peptisase S24 domain
MSGHSTAIGERVYSGNVGPSDAYYAEVETDRMAPVFRRGDSLMVAPHDKAVRADRDYLLRKGSGSRIVHVVALSPRHIDVRQYQPSRIVRLSRARWAVVGRIFGVAFNRPRGAR